MHIPLTTSEKQLIRKLHEREHFLDQVANNSPDLIYVLDLKKLKLTYTNKLVREMMGASTLFLDEILPDEIELRRKHLTACGRLKANEMLDLTLRMKVRSGAWHWFWVRHIAMRFEIDGSVSHVIGVARDIQREKLREEALVRKKEVLNRVLDAQTTGLAAFGTVRASDGEPEDFEFLLTSKNFEDFYSRTDLVGKKLYAEYPEERAKSFDHFRKVLQTGIPFTVEENYTRTQTGTTHLFSIKYEKFGDGALVIREEIPGA